MRATSEAFQEYLAPDEAILYSGSGTLLDGADRLESAIGVTDRRVLFVSGQGGFTDIAHEYIASIRSRPRTRYTSSGIGYRLLAIGGALLAASAFAGVVGLTSGVLAPLLALLAIGGVLAAERVRRDGVAFEEIGPDRISSKWDALKRSALDRIGFGDYGRQPRDTRTTRGYGADTYRDLERRHLLVGLGVVVSLSFVGLGVLTANPPVVGLTIAAFGSVAVSNYAYRRKTSLDRLGASHRREREMNIHLISGRVVRTRIDAAEEIDRNLSRVAGTRTYWSANTEIPR